MPGSTVTRLRFLEEDIPLFETYENSARSLQMHWKSTGRWSIVSQVDGQYFFLLKQHLYIYERHSYTKARWTAKWSSGIPRQIGNDGSLVNIAGVVMRQCLDLPILQRIATDWQRNGSHQRWNCLLRRRAACRRQFKTCNFFFIFLHF